MGASVTQVIPDPVTGVDKIVGTAAAPFVTSRSDGAGGIVAEGTALPPGRAAAAQSVPTVLSTEDKSALDAANSGYSTASAYTDNVVRAAGRGILANITTAGTATLTFGGANVQFTFAVGPTILPLAITKTVLGTAQGTFYAIS